jgi:hypothetical protein
MGVGVVYPDAATAARTLGLSPSSSKLIEIVVPGPQDENFASAGVSVLAGNIGSRTLKSRKPVPHTFRVQVEFREKRSKKPAAEGRALAACRGPAKI